VINWAVIRTRSPERNDLDGDGLRGWAGRIADRKWSGSNNIRTGPVRHLINRHRPTSRTASRVWPHAQAPEEIERSGMING